MLSLLASPGSISSLMTSKIEGRDLLDLKKKLELIFDRCDKHGFVLSRKKFEINTTVEFAGFVISPEGVFPCTRCLEAISGFPRPQDVSGLRSFLGLCNPLSIFIPDLAASTSILRTPLKNYAPFIWTDEHESNFKTIKEKLVRRLALHHFDRSLHTKLITDASKLHGIGFVLIQTSDVSSTTPIRILQCGSRSLGPAEKNYSVIELECLAIQWALLKCNYFLCGLSDFHIITNHRPLVGVFGKTLSDVDNWRLVRLQEKTSSFSFEVKWIAGKNNVIADAFSRFPVEKCNDTPLFSCILGQSSLVAEIRKAAKACPTYSSIHAALSSGKEPLVLPPSHPGHTLQNVWHRLSVLDDDLICLDSRCLYVPSQCRREVLELLHRPHPGIVRMYKTARIHYYWPGLKNDVTNLVQNCSACQVHRPCLPVDTFVTTSAKSPMEQTSADLFQIGNYII